MGPGPRADRRRDNDEAASASPSCVPSHPCSPQSFALCLLACPPFPPASLCPLACLPSPPATLTLLFACLRTPAAAAAGILLLAAVRGVTAAMLVDASPAWMRCRSACRQERMVDGERQGDTAVMDALQVRLLERQQQSERTWERWGEEGLRGGLPTSSRREGRASH